jgi:hypothetical protein
MVSNNVEGTDIKSSPQDLHSGQQDQSETNQSSTITAQFASPLIEMPQNSRNAHAQ